MTIFFCSLLVYLLVAVAVGLIADVQYILWIVLYGLLLTVSTVYSFIARGYGYGGLYALSGVVSTVVTVVLNLVLICWAHMDYQALYLSSIAAMLVQAVMLECRVHLSRKIRWKLDKAYLKTMFRYCLPLCLNSVAYWALTSLNKVIVTFLLGADANGLLAMANKFVSILYLLSTCFQLAWQELAYSKPNDLVAETGHFYSKATNLYSKILVAGLIVILPAVSLVWPFFIDAQYAAAKVLVPLAMLGTVFSILSSFLGTIFGGLKKSSVIFVTTMIGAVVNVGLLFLLLYLGMDVQAANIAFLVGYLVNDILRIVMVKRYIPYRVEARYYLLLLPIFVVEMLIFTQSWTYNLVALLGFGIVALLMLRSELSLLWNKIKGRKRNERAE